MSIDRVESDFTTSEPPEPPSGYFSSPLKYLIDSVHAVWSRSTAPAPPEAQYEFDVLCDTEEGATKSSDETAFWYNRIAAGQGYAPAEFNLGIMYYHGEGVEQSDAYAREWLQKAADQGFSPAQVALGAMYASGRGVTQSDELATSWYQKAADQGNNPLAQLTLAYRYGSGRGVAKSEELAKYWLQKAVDQGYEPALALVDPRHGRTT